MRRLIAALTAAACVAGAAGAAPLVVGVDHPGDAVLQDAQYFYLGRNWCWYDDAWRGPGFYWCGFAWRRGYGWGGPVGWRGWYGGPRYWRGGVWIGPNGYRHPEWRGGHDGDHGRDYGHDGDHGRAYGHDGDRGHDHHDDHERY